MNKAMVNELRIESLNVAKNVFLNSMKSWIKIPIEHFENDDIKDLFLLIDINYKKYSFIKTDEWIVIDTNY